MSLFVVAFAVYPIGNELFRRAETPKRLLPAALALGSFTMTAFPGTPPIQNTIPMPYFNTTPFAAPIFGTLAGLGMLIFGTVWLNRRRTRAAAKGEGYGEHEPTHSDAQTQPATLPPTWRAALPVVAVIALNALSTYLVIPWMDTSYLSQEDYGGAEIGDVRGIWAIIASLVIAIALVTALNWPRFDDLKQSFNRGTLGSLLPVFNTASEVGYGAVIASLPAFMVIRDAVLGISSNPLLSSAVATNVLAGITGSASGGMSIALETLGGEFMSRAQAAGIDPEIMHRVVALSSGGFDALPHNGAVITLLAITGLSHRQSYADIFVVAVLIPFSLTLLVILGASI